jgi:hypothetical protein
MLRGKPIQQLIAGLAQEAFTYGIDLLWLEDILRNIYSIVCKKFLFLYDLLIFFYFFEVFIRGIFVKKRKEKETSVLDNLNQKVKRKKIKIKNKLKQNRGHLALEYMWLLHIGQNITSLSLSLSLCVCVSYARYNTNFACSFFKK